MSISEPQPEPLPHACVRCGRPQGAHPTAACLRHEAPAPDWMRRLVELLRKS